MLIYVIGGFKYQLAVYVTSLTANFFIAAFALMAGLEVIMGRSYGDLRPGAWWLGRQRGLAATGAKAAQGRS
jgi:hypothetical protein